MLLVRVANAHQRGGVINNQDNGTIVPYLLFTPTSQFDFINLIDGIGDKTLEQKDVDLNTYKGVAPVTTDD